MSSSLLLQGAPGKRIALPTRVEPKVLVTASVKLTVLGFLCERKDVFVMAELHGRTRRPSGWVT